MKTWDLLDRQTGEVLLRGWSSVAAPEEPGVLERWEVAYCRETGEVVYR